MTAANYSIRAATEADAPALPEIYKPYAEDTAVSFELEPPNIDEFAARIRKVIGGYAYGSTHRERPAYRWSVEGHGVNSRRPTRARRVRPRGPLSSA